MSNSAQFTHSCFVEVIAENTRELGYQLGSLFGDWTKTQILEQSGTDLWNKKREIMIQLLPSISEWKHDLIVEMQAYAEAADVAPIDAWVLSVENEFEENAVEKCTTVVANRGTLLAHNEDWLPEAASSICLLKKQVGKMTVLEFHYLDSPLGGTAFSVNSFGLCHAINSLPSSGSGRGLPRNVIARMITECRGVGDAVELLQKVPRYSGYNHVLAKNNCVATNVECSAHRTEISTPTLPFVHTNHYLHAARSEKFAQEASASSFERYRDAMASANAEMSMFDAAGILSKSNVIRNDRTIGSIVVDLTKRSAMVWLRRESELGWLSYDLDFLIQ